MTFPRHIDDGVRTPLGYLVLTTTHPRKVVELSIAAPTEPAGYVQLAPDEARAIATDLLIRADQAEGKRA